MGRDVGPMASGSIGTSGASGVPLLWEAAGWPFRCWIEQGGVFVWGRVIAAVAASGCLTASLWMSPGPTVRTGLVSSSVPGAVAASLAVKDGRSQPGAIFVSIRAKANAKTLTVARHPYTVSHNGVVFGAYERLPVSDVGWGGAVSDNRYVVSRTGEKQGIRIYAHNKLTGTIAQKRIFWSGPQAILDGPYMYATLGPSNNGVFNPAGQKLATVPWREGELSVFGPLSVTCKHETRDGCSDGNYIVRNVISKKSWPVSATVPTVTDDHGAVIHPYQVVRWALPTILGRSLLVSTQANFACRESPNEDIACAHPTRYDWFSVYDWTTDTLRHTWTFAETPEGNCTYSGDEARQAALGEDAVIMTVNHYAHANHCISGASPTETVSTDTRIYRLDLDPASFTIINSQAADLNSWVFARQRPQGRTILLSNQSGRPARLLLLNPGVLPPQTGRLIGAWPTGWSLGKHGRIWQPQFDFTQSILQWRLTIRRPNGHIIFSQHGSAKSGSVRPTWFGRVGNKATGKRLPSGRYAWELTGSTPDGGSLVNRLDGPVTGHLRIP